MRKRTTLCIFGVGFLLTSMLLLPITSMSSGSFTMAVSEYKSIVVDGLSNDWKDVEPVFVDAESDMKIATDDGSDMKAIYSVKDDKNLYIMIEFYGKANHSNYIDLYFNDKPEGPADHFMFKEDGFISWSRSWEEKGVKVGYWDVAEVSFPLTFFADLTVLYVNPGVYIPSIEQWDDGAGKWVVIWIDESKGVSIEYRVTIHKASRLIEICAHTNNLRYFVSSNVFFKFNSHWHYRTYPYYLVNLTFSSNGAKLGYQLAGEDVWNVSLPEDVQEVYAHYFLNITREPAHSNYFGEDFIVSYVGGLFIYPDTDGILEIRFKFELPSGWIVAAQWDEQDGEFVTRNVEYIKRGFIAIGKYEIDEFQISDVTLVVAVHMNTTLSRNDLVRHSKNCFSNMMSFLKYPFPDAKMFLVIFAPPPSMCGTADFSGPSCTVDSMIDLMDLRLPPHEMFHVLGGFGGPWVEGITEYYGYKVSWRAGSWDQDRFYLWLTTSWPGRDWTAGGLHYYYTNIWNSRYNVPIVSDAVQQNDDYVWIRYYKGAIVAYMLDKEIQRVTNGNRSLDDVVSYLNAKYLDPTHWVEPEEYLQTVNFVAGYNFTDFFSKYIYGSDWLPPVPIRDWFDWYITEAERLLIEASQPSKESLEKLNGLKIECDNIISSIYEKRYSEAFSKIKGVIEDFKSLLNSIQIMTPWPEVAIVSPAEGSLIRGVIPIRTNVTADAGVQRVEFYISDRLVHTDYNAPYGWDWNTAQYSDGAYAIKLVVYDKVGNSKTTQVTVTVDNTPPSVEVRIWSPENPSAGEEVVVEASATDETSGIANVTLWCRVEGDEWKFIPMALDERIWKTMIPGQSSGATVEFYIEAYDQVGNRIESKTYSYMVTEVVLITPVTWSTTLLIGTIIGIVALIAIYLIKLRKR